MIYIYKIIARYIKVKLKTLVKIILKSLIQKLR